MQSGNNLKEIKNIWLSLTELANRITNSPFIWKPQIVLKSARLQNQFIRFDQVSQIIE